MLSIYSEEYCSYRILSRYTKPEIIALGGQLTGDMIQQLISPLNATTRVMRDNVVPKSIKFPNLYMTGGTVESRRKEIKDFYKQPEKTKELLDQFEHISADDLQKWKDGKACFLIEPLIGIVTYELVGEEKVVERWILTCAELGLLALNGLASGAGKFYTGALSGTAYKALPYGTFKENDGLIKAIKPYTGSKTIYEAIHNNEGFREMVNTLGCLEINTLEVATPSDTTPVDQ